MKHRWRSLLYVPVTRGDFVAKAHTRGADVIKLDLEDSIPPTEKARAREELPGAVDALTRAGCVVAVRINRPWRMAVRDLEAAVRPGVSLLALPKVPGAGHLRAVAEIVEDLERERNLPPGGIRFLPMVETAAGLQRVEEIADAHPRVVAITLGGEDFATDLAIEPEPDLLQEPKQRLIVAARAAGIVPLGLLGTIADYRDRDAFAETVRRSRRLGFVGASAIHPAQVEVLNTGFAPHPEEIASARRVVAEYRRAQAEGIGAISLEGRMVDEPIAQRAEALLEAADVPLPDH